MPISSFMGLETSLRGLLAQQRALDVTTHNIANADRTGYTRQEAVMAAAPALAVPGAFQNGGTGQLGQGVDVEAYRRLRDSFADLQFRAANMSYGDGAARANALDQVDDAFGEPSDSGLNAALSTFFDSWDALAANPESSAAKQAVVGTATALASAFNALDGRLAALAGNAATEYADLTGPNGAVMNAAGELQRLNVAIRDAVQGGGSPNDLLDRRDEILDGLSQLGQVSVTDLGNGMIAVQFGDATSPLVDAANAVNAPVGMTAPGGRLGALLGVQTTIAGYRTSLDTLAAQLAGAVNAAQGGTTFFTGATAATLAVGVNAAGVQTTGTGAAGANELARAVAALRNGAVQAGYADLVHTMGADAATADRAAQTGKALVDAADSRRQSTNGVSLDEEMANMVRFQRGYQASARAMSTMDEMLDVLINRTGRVGL
jgi:flagellar hook-associated protein 1 FlgK